MSETEMPDGLPQPCPVCGAYSVLRDSQISALLAVCDTLVIKALERLGRYLTRKGRAQYRTLMNAERPFHEAHTLLHAEEVQVDKALRDAWDVVPAMLDTHGGCGVTPLQVTAMLDEYVRDLAITGTAHHIDELRYRFTDRLGLPVYDWSASGQEHDHADA